MNNPLTKDFKSKFGLPPFEEIKPKHYLPAFKKAIADHKTEIELILKNKEKHHPNPSQHYLVVSNYHNHYFAL